jgi:subtilase family serine protease
MRAGRRLLGALSLGALLLGGAALGYAQDDTSAAVRPRPTPSRLVDPIDERALVTLKGNVRADVAHAPDLGTVEDAKPLNLFLLLQRSTAQQADLDSLIARQQEPGAPEYHKWLTPAEFGARFGASPQDITKLSTWLQSHGFKIRSVLNNASMIDFEATAGQVREAFHAQLHYVSVRGGKYPALRQDPQIPAALIPVVAGIEGLNKIPPQANHGAPRQASRDQATHRWHIVNPTPADTASPDYSDGSGDYLVGPQDLYTIYKINPVFTGGNLAATATVAVIEQSDIEYGTVTSGVATGGDVATFRSVFGVPGTLNMHVYHGYGSVTCNDPGIAYSDEFEATLDAEWANTTAPSANLIFMSCDDDPDDGIFTSMTALIDNNLSDVMSVSYGTSEDSYTSSLYTQQDNLFEQAATQGQSIVISAGDGGSDVRDTHFAATVGVNVNGLSSSPLVTSAGGTDFQDYYDAQENGKPQSTYWNSTNSTYYGDAISYIPETAWNQSCAGSLGAELAGYPGAAYCAYFGTVPPFSGSGLAGSGGISTHYAAPAWQTGISGYSNPMRSQPDIAGFASSFWFHALLLCDSNPDDGDPCTSPSTFGAGDGTSFVAPYTAGEVGLLVAATGSRQGVLNPALYALAKAQYAAPATATACYANGQTSNTGVTTSLPAAACIFNDVTTGNNDVPCTAGSTDCYVNSGASYGILSLTGSSSLTVAYASAAGYDQVTGIGSVNVANLIADWNTAFTSSTSLTANPTSINSSQSTDLTATVTGGTPTGYVDTPPAVTGTVTFKAGTTVVGTCTLTSGTCSTSVPASSLQTGSNSMTAIFGGSGTYPSSTSSIVTVTVEASLITPTVTVTPAYSQVTTAQSDQVTVAVNGGSGNPTPTGSVTVSSGTYTSSPTTLTSGSASITVPAGQLAVGSDTLTATYSGDTNYTVATGTAPVTVAQAIGSCTTANPNPNPNPAVFAATQDFNGDCRSDILWRNSSTEQVYEWLMNGTTYSGSGSPGSPTSDWVIQGAGDFNGDGKADILWRNTTTGEVFIWLMNGTTFTSSGSLGYVSSDWTIAGVGDFNGDGKADILWQNSSGEIYLWLMNGTTIAGGGIVNNVSPGWSVAGIGDFNGDGMADILWRNTTTGQVYVWLMNGTTIASMGSPGTPSSDWSIAGVGDFDGNGTSDILWQNSTTGQVYIWFMNGTTFPSSGSVGYVSSGWVIQGVGDYDGSGRAGILWRNSTTEQVYIWLMNGVTLSSSGSPGSPDITWQIAP